MLSVAQTVDDEEDVASVQVIADEVAWVYWDGFIVNPANLTDFKRKRPLVE